MQKILVVEDDFDIRELLQNFLQEAGYEVATAKDVYKRQAQYTVQVHFLQSIGFLTAPRDRTHQTIWEYYFLVYAPLHFQQKILSAHVS